MICPCESPVFNCNTAWNVTGEGLLEKCWTSLHSMISLSITKSPFVSSNRASTASDVFRSVRQSSHSGEMAACDGDDVRSSFVKARLALPNVINPWELTHKLFAPVYVCP